MSVHQIYQKAIRDNWPYVQKGHMTVWESDMLARKNVCKYLVIQARVEQTMLEILG